MPKYIDFDALGVQSCNPDVFENKGYAYGWNNLMAILYKAPAADVEPVRYGFWISHPNHKDDICSVCGRGVRRRIYEDGEEIEYNFQRCPWCGAVLIGGGEDA